MACRSCIDPHYSKRTVAKSETAIVNKKEVSFMKCDECGCEQFKTRRKNHIPIEYVCDGCGATVPIKSKSKEKKSWLSQATDSDLSATTDS